MFRTALTISMMFSLPAFATPRGGGGGPGGKQGNPACAPIRAACEKAGYKGRGAGGGNAGQAGSPGTLRDCMQKWSGGGSIPGLNIKSTDASAKDCVTHMAKMKERGGRRGGPGGPGGQMNAQGGPGGRREGPGGPGGPGRGGGPGNPGAMGAGRSQPGMNKPSPLLNSRPAAPTNSAPAVLPPKPAPPAATPPPKKP